AGLLPAVVLMPLGALILHSASPSGGASSKSGNLLHAKAALVFQWVYGAFLTWLSIAAMSSPEGFVLKGGEIPLGVTSLVFNPILYLDGRNAPFVLLMGLCLPLVFTWLRDRDGRYGPSYYVSANLLSLSLAGVFVSDSLLLFYLFWEFALIGAYFWFGMHGRANIHSGSVYGALVRFFLFTLVGSLPMLVSIAALCAAAGRDPGISGIAAIVQTLP